MTFLTKHIGFVAYFALFTALSGGFQVSMAIELNHLGRTQEKAFEDHQNRIRAMCYYNPGLPECEAMRKRLEETLEEECLYQDNRYACTMRENVYFNSNEVGKTGIGPAKLNKNAKYNFGPWRRFMEWWDSL